MDRQIYRDRLLESENLTDKLDDDAADILLNWGIAQVDNLLAGIDDDEIAGTKINHLMRFMRKVNSMAGSPSRITTGTLAELLQLYEKVFGKARKSDESENGTIAKTISKMQPKEAVSYILEWLDSEKG